MSAALRRCDRCSSLSGPRGLLAGAGCADCAPFPTRETSEPSGRRSTLTDRRLSGSADGSLDRGNGSAPDALDRTAARARALGIKVESGALTKSFGCILNGHTHRARLHPVEGFWHYRCPELPRHLELAELRALIDYRRLFPLSVIERARWLELLDYDAGISPRGPAAIPLPPDSTEATLRVGHAWRLHVGLRDAAIWPANEPYVFARLFVMARAHVSTSEARRAVQALERFGAMVRVGVNGRAILWRPGTADDVALRAEEAAVEAMKDAFNATEESP